MGGKGGVGADCFERCEVKAADELPSSNDSILVVRSLSLEGSPQRYFDGRRRDLRLLFYLLDELFYELVLVLGLPTVLNRTIAIINILIRFHTAPINLLILLEQLLEGSVANLLEVVLLIYLFHIVFPCLNYAVLMRLGNCLLIEEELAHEEVGQSGDVFEVRIVGFDIFVEVLDNEVDEAGPVFSKIYNLLADVNAGTDADDDIFDEIVAVPEALILEQFCLAVLEFDGEGVIGTNGVLNFPLELNLLLLFLLDQ